MTLFQAIRYFAAEALLNMLRSWKISLLAISTIAVSLFLTGVFLIASANVAALVESWQAESRIVIYLEDGASDVDSEALRQQALALAWVSSAELVDREQAETRFLAAFPSLGDLLEGWEETPLPASIELEVDWQRLEGDTDSWLDPLRASTAVSSIDEDRDWLAQLDTVAWILRMLALAAGAVLLVTAIFTISSVIRLTAFLYQDEIAVMRMVGATEFFIRGPFYAEGLIQGLAGGALATGLLAAAYSALHQFQGDSLLVSLTAGRFLPLSQLVAMVSVGGLAGLFGAVSSLRGERLAQSAEGDWAAGA